MGRRWWTVADSFEMDGKVFYSSDLGAGCFDNEKMLDFLDEKMLDIILKGDPYDEDKLTELIMAKIPKDAPVALTVLLNTARSLSQMLLILIESYLDINMDVRKVLVEYYAQHQSRGE